MFEENYTEVLCRIAVRVTSSYGIASLVVCEINLTPNQTLTQRWYVLLLSMFIGQRKKYGRLGGSRSREIGIFKQLLRSSPGIVFCVFAENRNKKWCIFFFLSRSRTISNTCILPAGNTPYWKSKTREQYDVLRLCSLSYLEEGLHSRQSFLVRLTNQFDAFFNPKNASETKATNK